MWVALLRGIISAVLGTVVASMTGYIMLKLLDFAEAGKYGSRVIGWSNAAAKFFVLAVLASVAVYLLWEANLQSEP